MVFVSNYGECFASSVKKRQGKIIFDKVLCIDRNFKAN